MVTYCVPIKDSSTEHQSTNCFFSLNKSQTQSGKNKSKIEIKKATNNRPQPEKDMYFVTSNTYKCADKTFRTEKKKKIPQSAVKATLDTCAYGGPHKPRAPTWTLVLHVGTHNSHPHSPLFENSKMATNGRLVSCCDEKKFSFLYRHVEVSQPLDVL